MASHVHVLFAIPHAKMLHNFTLYFVSLVTARLFLLPVSEQRAYPILLFRQ